MTFETLNYFTELNLPAYDFKVRNLGDQRQIYDLLRKKFVFLTPEEWVRQHFINFLISEKKYPASLIAIEHRLKIHSLVKRADLVVFNRFGNPWMIIECKSTVVDISEDTLYQAARYNMKLNVQYLVLTNGMQHYCCRYDDKELIFLDDLPGYPDKTI